MGWVGPRGNAQPPFFVFSHQCILNKERFWHGKEEGKTTPGKKKSQKLYVVPTIMSQLLRIFRDQPIAADTCTYPPRKTKKSTDETSCRQEWRPAQVSNLHPTRCTHQQHTVPSRPHTPGRPYPTNVPGIRKHQRATSVVLVYHVRTVTQHHSLGWAGGGWRRKSARASGGSCLGLTGGCWSLPVHSS